MTRIHRERLREHREALDRRPDLSLASGSDKLLLQIYNGGSMPSYVPGVYLGHPVSPTWAETAGSEPSLSVDSSKTFAVLMLGKAPVAGDMVIAHDIAGRWVAEKGITPATFCSPCPIPRKTLTVSWTNSMLGNGSTPLVYVPPGVWSTGCINQLILAMDCLGGIIQFVVTYFLSGECPSGQSQSCQSPGYAPFGLTLVDYTCDPFHLHYQIVGAECPLVSGIGYTDFYVDE